MPSGDNNRRLGPADIDEIVRRYTTPQDDGTWIGTTTLGRDFGVRPATVSRWLRLRGVRLRSARESHKGKRCKPVRNVPRGTAPRCKCGCGSPTEWSRRKNRWQAYVAGHYRREAPYKDRAWLQRRYIEENATLRELAAECGVEIASVIRYMDRFGLPRRNASDAHRGQQAGALNPAWKGGVAKWPYSSDWKVLARAVRDRDEWICQDCGAQRVRWGNGLHVHHIDGDKLNNRPANLISLCAGCHRERHRS